MEFIVLTSAFLWFLSRKPEYHPVLEELKKNLVKIDPSFGTIHIYPSGETYAHNKRDIYICIQNQDGKYYDMNTLVYVSLHEIAHIITRGEKEDHDEKFLKNFSILLKKAREKGVFDGRKPIPKDYCKVNGK